MVGVLCSDVSDKHYAKAVSIIERELRAKDYDSILGCTGGELEDKKKAIDVLLSKRVDALILVGSIFQEKTENSHIGRAAGKIPVIIINGEYGFHNTYSVACDEKDAVRQCVLELSRAGHRDILYMYDVESFSGINKIAGYKQGIKDAGLMMAPQNIIKCERTLEDAKNAVLSALDRGVRFSAVVTAEDVIAVGALKALAGRDIAVPGDVAVVGFNNSVLAECATPALTSIDNRIEALCMSAVKTMLDVFEGKRVENRQVIKGALEYRESFIK
jgi:LacI family transcriptional regulator/LacI family asc operon transcriptional repressor